MKTAVGVVALDAELACCRVACEAGAVTPATLQRVWPVVERFAVFVRARVQCPSLGAVSPGDVDGFVRARLLSGRPATLLTMHDRRATVRLLFRVARGLGIVTGDPTLDVVLPARSSSAARPLTDDEIEIGRDAALWSLTSHRMAAIWALSEATGRGAELSKVLVRHVNLDLGRVWLEGGARTCRRWGTLTPWGIAVLRARLGQLDGRDVPIGYAGQSDGTAGQVSTCSAVSTVLVRAGLAGEADVRPTSVAAWAGVKVFEATGSIDQVARTLGVPSLDQAARIIGWEWSV